jgi:hypothetical protein
VACAAIAAWRAREDVTLAAITVAPPAAAVVGFAFWQSAYQHYWLMPVMPCVGLMAGLALTNWRPAARPLAGALLFFVLAAQPARFADAQTIYRLPTYGALVRGSQEIRRRSAEIRAIDIEFAVHPSTNTHFIYERVLGGRVAPTAAFSAVIERSGHVRFVPLPPASQSAGGR